MFLMISFYSYIEISFLKKSVNNINFWLFIILGSKSDQQLETRMDGNLNTISSQSHQEYVEIDSRLDDRHHVDHRDSK